VTAEEGAHAPLADATFEFLQSGVDTVVVGSVDGACVPAKRAEYGLQVRHRKSRPVERVQLPMVLIHKHTQIIQVILARVHDRFPDGTFL
jgi:hypothetical protein